MHVAASPSSPCARIGQIRIHVARDRIGVVIVSGQANRRETNTLSSSTHCRIRAPDIRIPYGTRRIPLVGCAMHGAIRAQSEITIRHRLNVHSSTLSRTSAFRCKSATWFRIHQRCGFIIYPPIFGHTYCYVKYNRLYILVSMQT